MSEKRSDSKRHHRVYPSFWTSNPHWSNDAKLLALFLLTGPHRRTEGLYRLPLGYMAGDLGWTEKRARKALDELIAENFVQFDERVNVLLICKALKHQGLDNPNQITAALAAIEELPRTELLQGLVDAAEQFCQPFAQRLRERLGQPLGGGSGEPIPGSIPHPHNSYSSTPTPLPPKGETVNGLVGIGDVSPERPSGKRARSVAEFDAEFAAWAANYFPGVDASAVKGAVSQSGCRSASELRSWALAAGEQWAGLLGLVNEREVA